jgi:antitoxin component YwqK of YwqJK toxin-antitoxin module
MNREGQWRGWHSNGQQESLGSYKNGKKEGNWVHWHPNGQVSGEHEFKNGIQHGRWVWRSLDGTLIPSLSGIYKAGKKVSDLPKK